MKKLIVLFSFVLIIAGCTEVSEPAQPTDEAPQSADPTVDVTLEPTVTAVTRSPTVEPAAATATTETVELLPSSNLVGADGLDDPLFPKFGNGGYDVQHYDLQINWNAESQAIRGTASISAIATQNLASFNLDLAGLTVDSIAVNGEIADFEREGEELIINVPQDQILMSGSLIETVVNYHGVPNPVRDGGFPVGWLQYDTGVYVVSEPTGSQSWFPVNNHPSDKATYALHITVPDTFVVAANGTPADPVEEGDVITYTFVEDDLMASYLVTVNIGDYDVQSEDGVQSGVPITNYIEKGVPAELFGAFENQDEILAMLIERFGPYPYDEIGAVVPAEDFGYALETQTIPIYGQGILSRAGDFVIVHELAHQWFGNSLSPATWDEIWLNEGFANYSEALWLEHTSGREAALGYMQTQYEIEAQFTVPPGVIKSGDAGTLFSGSVYQRGGLTLHALRLTVGDEAFFEILKTYAARFEHGNVTTEDFIAIAEEVSGDELDALFDAWLYQAELPDLPEQ